MVEYFHQIFMSAGSTLRVWNLWNMSIESFNI